MQQAPDLLIETAIRWFGEIIKSSQHPIFIRSDDIQYVKNQLKWILENQTKTKCIALNTQETILREILFNAGMYPIATSPYSISIWIDFKKRSVTWQHTGGEKHTIQTCFG